MSADPTIFIGSLPGEEEIKLLVDGHTVAVFLPDEIEHPRSGEPVEHRWGNADRLLFALVNGRGGWTSYDPEIVSPTGEIAWELTPRPSNQESSVRLGLRVA